MTVRDHDRRRCWEGDRPEVTSRDRWCPLRTEPMFSVVFSYVRLQFRCRHTSPILSREIAPLRSGEICSPCGAFWSILVRAGRSLVKEAWVDSRSVVAQADDFLGCGHTRWIGAGWVREREPDIRSAGSFGIEADDDARRCVGDPELYWSVGYSADRRKKTRPPVEGRVVCKQVYATGREPFRKNCEWAFARTTCTVYEWSRTPYTTRNGSGRPYGASSPDADNWVCDVRSRRRPRA